MDHKDRPVPVQRDRIIEGQQAVNAVIVAGDRLLLEDQRLIRYVIRVKKSNREAPCLTDLFDQHSRGEQDDAVQDIRLEPRGEDDGGTTLGVPADVEL